MLFPSKFEDFKILYESINNSKNPIDEVILRRLFEGEPGTTARGWKNKPYIAVSFVDDPKSIKFLPLLSKTRTWKEIENTIVDGKLLKRIAKAITEKNKAKKDSVQ
jgi:hypothetical protein